MVPAYPDGTTHDDCDHSPDNPSRTLDTSAHGCPAGHMDLDLLSLMYKRQLGDLTGSMEVQEAAYVFLSG